MEMFICTGFSILVSVAIAFYYSFLNNIDSTWNDKLKGILKLDKKYLIISFITFFVGIFSFLVCNYIYKDNVIVTLKWQLIVMILIPISYIDFKEQIVPNKLLIISLIFGMPIIIFDFVINSDNLINLLIITFGGALLAGGIFFLSSLIVKGGVGAGDIKMLFVFGLILGIRCIFNVLLFSMVVSALTGIILLIFRKKNGKDFLPLAPFILIGTLIAILLGV